MKQSNAERNQAAHAEIGRIVMEGGLPLDTPISTVQVIARLLYDTTNDRIHEALIRAVKASSDAIAKPRAGDIRIDNILYYHAASLRVDVEQAIIHSYQYPVVP